MWICLWHSNLQLHATLFSLANLLFHNQTCSGIQDFSQDKDVEKAFYWAKNEDSIFLFSFWQSSALPLPPIHAYVSTYCALGQAHSCGFDMLLAWGKGRGEWHDEWFLDLVTTETRWLEAKPWGMSARRGGGCLCRTKYLSLLGEKAPSLKQFPFSVYKWSLLYKGFFFLVIHTIA